MNIGFNSRNSTIFQQFLSVIARDRVNMVGTIRFDEFSDIHAGLNDGMREAGCGTGNQLLTPLNDLSGTDDKPVSAILAAESGKRQRARTANIPGCPAARLAENMRHHLDLLEIILRITGTGGKICGHPAAIVEQQNSFFRKRRPDIHEGRRFMAGEDIQNHHGQGAVTVRFTGAGYRRFRPFGIVTIVQQGDIQTLETIPIAHLLLAFDRDKGEFQVMDQFLRGQVTPDLFSEMVVV